MTAEVRQYLRTMVDRKVRTIVADKTRVNPLVQAKDNQAVGMKRAGLVFVSTSRFVFRADSQYHGFPTN